jgi:replicative superfamily II helicase
MTDRLADLIQDLDLRAILDTAAYRTVGRILSEVRTPEITEDEPTRLPRLAFLFEAEGIRLYREWSGTRDETKRGASRQAFEQAYRCWAALLDLTADPLPSSVPGGERGRRGPSKAGVSILAREVPESTIRPELNLAFRLAVSAVLAERPAEARLELERFAFERDEGESGLDWRQDVATHTVRSFALLVRKSRGWVDIDAALDSLSKLRQLQKEFEESYIARQSEVSEQTRTAVELVGLYHLAQIATLTGAYLRDGTPELSATAVRLERHLDRASQAFQAADSATLQHLGSLLWAGCHKILENSIWSHVRGLGQGAIEFARALTDRGRPRPVIELWPSQQEALRRNLLDPYPRAVIVEMPTSAGKTLLAEFAIVQTKALNPEGIVAYIVPTRALVNQVTATLRADLATLGKRLQIEQAVPVFELDPTEERLLSSRPDVLVTTAEKFDLLVRRNHPATQALSLVVADEVHNLADGERGTRLELLLGTLKRERPDCRFLLLSPFLPNAGELVSWLGDAKQLPPISVDWKPSRQVVGSIDISGKGSNRAVVLETLPAAHAVDMPPGVRLVLGKSVGETKKTIASVSLSTVLALRRKGGVLVLCRGKGTAETRSRQIADNSTSRPLSELASAVSAYVEAEVGGRTALADCIAKGVAYHHAGMSHEARWLVESLIKSGDIDVICGTTTLAQGVNFPISSVIVETLKKGDKPLGYQDFWNVAGRAGRTLVDTVGMVGFPAPTKEQKAHYVDFLQKEAQEILSQLSTIIDHADEIEANLGVESILRWPELSSLLQFLAHAMRVAKSDDLIDDVEDLLRASLIYHQARRAGGDAATRLVHLCRQYLESIGSRRGVLGLADQTGFSTPSVLKLLGDLSPEPAMRNSATWAPEVLFGDDISPLTGRIRVVSGVPEIRLGGEERAPFNPKRVASIIRDWVNGKSLQAISAAYFAKEGKDEDDALTESNNYLFSKVVGLASWALGALETVCLSDADQSEWSRVGHVPAMVYYGVSSREAVWLRMIGVPRTFANSLGREWAAQSRADPESYDSIRDWVGGLQDDSWTRAIPSGSSLTPRQCRRLMLELAGAA